MFFTLTYDGILRGSRSSAAVKHDIRRSLHPQLKALWQLPPLATRSEAIDTEATGGGAGRMVSTVGSHTFAALVNDVYHLRARLHILMLRRDSPGGLMTHGGDIDNRLKTLFDALQRPQHPQEIPADWHPSEDESPLHCLLGDDRLVTRVDVDTARWLMPGDPAEVRLVINVEVWTPSPTYWSLGVIG
ncbi:hypothetical protein [Micromonospora sp. U21]|uniref:hypothetical protein n=1 Tax=Micromonospora sp. U21 TaxID=2824899 RepID=UPI001B38F97A|nr:hypothetical protein [Micromonospora sp. U21]MBQ0903582.1 hypothetical protein [Micromonospora sp. U21]